MYYICPTCQQPLIKRNNQLMCSKNHQFDIAKKGYINLLLNPQKPSNHPGDAIASLEARHRFLNTGAYDFIIKNIYDLIQHYQPQSLLDMGCGEGYYPAWIQRQREDLEISAFDISKEAVQAATRYTKKIHWFVANATTIPILSKSQDMVLSMFSFYLEEEVTRVLNDEGIFILVQAGPSHLIEMKQMMYQTVFEKTWEAPVLKTLSYIETISIKQTTTLNDTSFIDLAMMTPHYYRMPKERRDQLLKTSHPTITMDVKLSVYKKTSK